MKFGESGFEESDNEVNFVVKNISDLLLARDLLTINNLRLRALSYIIYMYSIQRIRNGKYIIDKISTKRRFV